MIYWSHARAQTVRLKQQRLRLYYTQIYLRARMENVEGMMSATNKEGKSRPMIISNAYLFDMKRLMPTLKQRGVKIGVATSVIKEQWNRAEIYPQNRCNTITLDETQRKLLRLFTN